MPSFKKLFFFLVILTMASLKLVDNLISGFTSMLVHIHAFFDHPESLRVLTRQPAGPILRVARLRGYSPLDTSHCGVAEGNACCHLISGFTGLLVVMEQATN